MERAINNNNVFLTGEVKQELGFSHEVFGEKFYTTILSTTRDSGTTDELPLMVSDRLVDVNENWAGKTVNVAGNFRSYNKFIAEGKRALILNVFVKEMCDVASLGELPPGFVKDKNHIELTGFICKQPTYRETPLGREICDILLAVNRSYGKSDYIPCITWGRNARYASGLDVGTQISIKGRVQSRIYRKQISDDEVVDRTAYEVSVSLIERHDESEEELNDDKGET